MDLDRMPVDGVSVGPRHRSLDDARVSALAESMNAIGLQQPITVWMESDSAVHLVAGHHRLEAARRLGWDFIDAFFVKMDAVSRELWEIDENLMRAELSDDEKREHLRRRKELWEARQEESGKSLSTLDKGGRGNKGFATETAAATGLSKQRINQLLADPKPKPPPSPPSAFPESDYERSATWRRRFESMWNSAPSLTDKEWAKEWIDRPIMDAAE